MEYAGIKFVETNIVEPEMRATPDQIRVIAGDIEREIDRMIAQALGMTPPATGAWRAPNPRRYGIFNLDAMA